MFVALIGFSLVIFISCSHTYMVVENPPYPPPSRIVTPDPEVALVLGGGAFHGIAHLGVLKIFEENGIPIDLIVGTSAGSLIGALYADRPYCDSLFPLVNSTKSKDVFDFSLIRSDFGFVTGKRLQNFIEKNCRVKNIEDTRIPFVAVTTDIMAGKTITLASGPIAPSVNASCAIPVVFEPVKMYDLLLVDGGVLNNIPADIAKKYNPKVILAVNVTANFDTTLVIDNMIDIIFRSLSIASRKIMDGTLEYADVVINPDLTGIPLMSDKYNQKMYDEGIKAAKAKLPEIIKLMKEKGIVQQTPAKSGTH